MSKIFSLPFFIGSRFGKSKKKSGFVSFITLSSIIGIAIGVIALTVGLSAMNGFERELEDRVLSVIPHGDVHTAYGRIKDYQTYGKKMIEDPHIVAYAPYVNVNALLDRRNEFKAMLIKGIVPKMENMVVGVEKFVFADNNSPNTEKLSEVIQDYVDKGIVDIIDLIGVRTSPSEFFNDTCGKYNQKCEWFLFFDFDEYLEVFFEKKKNKTLGLKEFLSNEIFNKCESIVFNWLIYTDNELLYYDKRPLNERFTEPYFKMWSNIFVKAMIRGNLNKTLFVKGQSHHIPDKGLKICDSMGRIIRHNPYSVSPPVFEYGYLKHFSEKTADESSDKVLRGIFDNPYDMVDRIKIFFATNKFSNEKLKIFEKKLNRTFDYNEISRSNHFRGNKGVNDD